jgi:aryl-alcohol dehydrogenase-like predicted oxidoreductase
MTLLDTADTYAPFIKEELVGRPRFRGENFRKNLDLVRRVEELAKKRLQTFAVWRWPGCWRRGNDIVPIPGTKRRKYLDENVEALNVELSAADLRRIEEVFPRDATAGLAIRNT